MKIICLDGIITRAWLDYPDTVVQRYKKEVREILYWRHDPKRYAEVDEVLGRWSFDVWTTDGELVRLPSVMCRNYVEEVPIDSERLVKLIHNVAVKHDYYIDARMDEYRTLKLLGCDDIIRDIEIILTDEDWRKIFELQPCLEMEAAGLKVDGDTLFDKYHQVTRYGDLWIGDGFMADRLHRLGFKVEVRRYDGKWMCPIADGVAHYIGNFVDATQIPPSCNCECWYDPSTQMLKYIRTRGSPLVIHVLGGSPYPPLTEEFPYTEDDIVEGRCGDVRFVGYLAIGDTRILALRRAYQKCYLLGVNCGCMTTVLQDGDIPESIRHITKVMSALAESRTTIAHNFHGEVRMASEGSLFPNAHGITCRRLTSLSVFAGKTLRITETYPHKLLKITVD